MLFGFEDPLRPANGLKAENIINSKHYHTAMNTTMHERSFLDGPRLTWTDILQRRSNCERKDMIKYKLATTDDPTMRKMLKSELLLLGEEDCESSIY